MKEFIIVSIFNFLIILSSCNSQTISDTSDYTAPSYNTDKIEVYHFYFSLRCVTCLTLEAKTKEFIEVLYPDQVRSGLITFKAFNFDEKSTELVAKRFVVMDQSLLLIKGGKKIDNLL